MPDKTYDTHKVEGLVTVQCSNCLDVVEIPYERFVRHGLQHYVLHDARYAVCPSLDTSAASVLVHHGCAARADPATIVLTELGEAGRARVIEDKILVPASPGVPRAEPRAVAPPPAPQAARRARAAG